MNLLQKILISGILFAGIFACGGGDILKPSSNEASLSLYADNSEAKDPLLNKGVGPVKNVELGDLNPEMASEGEMIFNDKCLVCHKTTENFIGPSPIGIFERRSPEWIMNMILNPEQILDEDPIAKELLKQFMAPMANQGLTEEEARKILEYFRTLPEDIKET